MAAVLFPLETLIPTAFISLIPLYPIQFQVDGHRFLAADSTYLGDVNSRLNLLNQMLLQEDG